MKTENAIALAIAVVGLAAAGWFWFSAPAKRTPAPSARSETPPKEEILLPSASAERYRSIPEVRRYLQEVRRAVASGTGVVPLGEEELDEGGKKAQEILLHDPRFLADTRVGGRVVHNDMMRIRPAIVSALSEKERSICAKDRCYQAEKYNFVTNTTTRAIVDVDQGKVLSVRRFPDTQPDISLRLKRIAEAIALHAPEVERKLGHTPHRFEITMANVRTSLKDSPCEDSRHLCVAPTFADQKAERALWAIVDLTDLRLAAAKWAGLGKTATPACISERTLQNRYIMENFCKRDQNLSREGWSLRYHLTGSDGLEIRDVRFRGHPILRSAKIVDWHVAYKALSGGEKLDTSTPAFMAGRRVEYVRGENGSFLFGYNDAMGCPMFSTSVVLAFNAPQITPLRNERNETVGFALSQDFRNPQWPMACNYRYENRFEFYRDGRFRIVGINKGRGCGDNAIYRPVMRIDTTLGDGKHERFDRYRDGKWDPLVREGEFRVDEDLPSAYKGRYPYRIVPEGQPDAGYLIEPNTGQFGDGSRGDHATLFVSRFHPEEGDTDMLTLGSCCNLKEDGPERFITPPESLQGGADLVLWYVPRIRNDDRKGHEYCWADTVIGEDGNLHVKVWPCTVGPMFVPVAQGVNR
ncbi:hypothetical protein [Nitratifractor sp.]